MSAPALFPPDRADLIRSGRRDGVRHVLEPAAWASLALELSPRAALVPLLGMWGDASGHVHALFADARVRPLVASVAVEAGRYHALSVRMEAAVPFERMIRDLWGFEAMFARDGRALLDHGRWAATAPLSTRPGPGPRTAETPEWRTQDDEGLAFVERGPVGLPLSDAARIRVTLAGELVRSVEMQLGWGHTGVLARVVGLTPAAAVGVAGRAQVAGAIAFSRAVEAATGTAVPGRAGVVREMAGELERACAFLTAIVACASSAGAMRLASEAALLLERLRAASGVGLGHRFGAGLVAPGGLARDLGDEAVDALGSAAETIAGAMGPLARLYEARDGLAARLAGVARVNPASASSVAASGIVGRASGQGFDARRAGAAVPVDAPLTEDGCADARMRLRLAGVGQAGMRLRRLIEVLPAGAVRAGLGEVTGEGLGVAEAPEGELWHFVRLAGDGTVASFFARDPGWAHAGLFEAACGGIAFEDVGPVRASFGLWGEAVAT